MKKYKLSIGLGGSFGGARELEEVFEFENENEAWEHAFVLACEEYDSYAGLYGLRSLDDIMEEDEIEDEEYALEVYAEERGSWIDYEVEEISDLEQKGN